jgi:hypothetical protein
MCGWLGQASSSELVQGGGRPLLQICQRERLGNRFRMEDPWARRLVPFARAAPAPLSYPDPPDPHLESSADKASSWWACADPDVVESDGLERFEETVTYISRLLAPRAPA